jgi:RNA recognition motif-containing protein
MDKITGRSRGFGFVYFGNKRDLQDAMDKLNGTEVEGRRISVTKAIPQGETAPGTPADALRRGHSHPRNSSYNGPSRMGGG